MSSLTCSGALKLVSLLGQVELPDTEKAGEKSSDLLILGDTMLITLPLIEAQRSRQL